MYTDMSKVGVTLFPFLNIFYHFTFLGFPFILSSVSEVLYREYSNAQQLPCDNSYRLPINGTGVFPEDAAYRQQWHVGTIRTMILHGLQAQKFLTLLTLISVLHMVLYASNIHVRVHGPTHYVLSSALMWLFTVFWLSQMYRGFLSLSMYI